MLIAAGEAELTVELVLQVVVCPVGSILPLYSPGRGCSECCWGGGVDRGVVVQVVVGPVSSLLPLYSPSRGHHLRIPA